ncbi:hypothetical protein SAMN02799615_03420 [Dyella marensis]|uniref:Uncharacterized protein n=1 Tax=Dyella marensis TaxID=500610 RepID=A0A1I2II71_9GAMM|nr:hypothetical protein SAMN02799615_03420 [Dyella marensis]
MTSDTVPEDMAFPLLRSIALRFVHEKNRRRRGFATGGEPRACGGRGKSGARMEQDLVRRRLGISHGLF